MAMMFSVYPRAAMIDMRNHPRLPPNPLLLASFDALWRNFGCPTAMKSSIMVQKSGRKNLRR